MAMTLQATRLRLTQAIYFGHPQAAVGSGFVRTNGTTPLTANWDAGAFAITSANSVDWVNVAQFKTGGTGTAGSPWTGWDTAIAWAAGKTYFFRAGYYSYAIAPNWALEGITLLGSGGVGAVGVGPTTVLQYTGAAATGAVSFDGGLGNPVLDSIRMENFLIQGNAGGTSPVGLFIRNVHRSTWKNIRVRQVTTYGVEVLFSVSSIFDRIVVSKNYNFGGEGFGAATPVNGVYSDQRTLLGECMTASNWINPIIEGCSGSGIKWTQATFNVIEGGTSEGCGVGIELGTYTYSNVISGLDCESNTGRDIVIDTTRGQNTFIAGTYLSPGPTGGLHIVNALNTTFVGTYLNEIVLDAGAISTAFWGGRFGGGFTNNGVSTQTQGVYGIAAPVDNYASAISRFDGKLGVNNAPIYDLDVLGTGYVHGGAVSLYMDAGSALFRDTTALAADIGYIDFPRIYFRDPSNAFAQQFVVANGKIGCGGVGIPTRELDISGTQRWRGIAAPAVAEANSGTIYFDSATNTLRASLNGSAYVDVIGSAGLTGSGTATKIGYWTAATTLAGAANIYTDAVNHRLGVKVAAPAYQIDCDGDINLTTGSVVRVNAVQVFKDSLATTSLAVGSTAGAAGLGADSTAVGYGAGVVATGAGNTAIGKTALGGVTTGIDNTAVGLNALSVTTGDKNTAIGWAAGLTNSTGSNNVFVGALADAVAGNYTNAVAIGYGAVVGASNAIALGNGANKVGLRTGTPNVTLDVAGEIAYRQLEITLANGLNSDISRVTESSWLRIIGPNNVFSIGGFTGGTDGQRLNVYNTVAFQMTIVNEDGASAAANRIWTLTGGDVVLRAGTSACSFQYDITDDRWILLSTN